VKRSTGPSQPLDQVGVIETLEKAPSQLIVQSSQVNSRQINPHLRGVGGGVGVDVCPVAVVRAVEPALGVVGDGAAVCNIHVLVVVVVVVVVMMVMVVGRN
jgi:hypothetical protein